MISKEEYETLRAKIIEELKEEKRAKDRARVELNEAAYGMFDETTREYMPKLMNEFYDELRKGYPTGSDSFIACRCKDMVDAAKRTVIELLCEKNAVTVYKNGRVEEANKLLADLLEDKIRRHREQGNGNAKQQ